MAVPSNIHTERVSHTSSQPRHTSRLSDEALIAFELEHERNRLQEELQRLQSAQSNVERSLEILSYIHTKMYDDPLSNPSKKNNKKNMFLTTHSMSKPNPKSALNTKQPKRPSILGAMSKSNPIFSNNSDSFTSSHDDSVSNDLPANLEFLPWNTTICLVNKSEISLSDLCVGDKVLSLCINAYPTNNAKNVPLPAPKAGTPVAAHSDFGAIPIMSSPQRSKPKSLSGLPLKKRTHAKTLTTSVLLPPPVQRTQSMHHKLNQHNEENGNEYIDEEQISQLSQRYLTKKDSVSRKSMPFVAYGSNGSNIPNFIEQSVTTAINESFEFPANHKGHNQTNSKGRSKSFAASVHALWSQEQKSHSADKADTDTNHHSNGSGHSRNGSRRASELTNTRFSASFTQIPGPLLPHQKLQQNSNTNNLQTRKRMNTYNGSVQRLPRSQNSSPRFSSSKPRSLFTANNGNSNKKNVRFSTTNGMKKPQTQLQRRANQKQGNYLEGVIVVQIYETEVYDFIEIVTENAMKIQCTATHLFWICGKGWGCVDSKSRMLFEKQNAMQSKQNRKKVRIPQLIYELQIGESLLTVHGKKYQIKQIHRIEEPNGIRMLGVVVNKNECFFANGLLVKNST